MHEHIHIDGARGEGGGQILRSAMALAAITGTPITIERIRARRAKPGLMRQHLTAVRAVAEVSGGRLEGDELGARALSFTPGRVRGGRYRFSVSTAGSACLVFQAVLWPLLCAEEPSQVVFEGGTHNPKAPPFDFLAQCFLPALRRMGARVQARIERPGFYPAGGGRFTVEIEPGPLSPLTLTETAPTRPLRARAVVANLPVAIARRELAAVRAAPGWSEVPTEVEQVRDSLGPGNALMLELGCGDEVELVTGFGERGKPAETVAADALDEARRYLEAGVPVGEHLADQLVIPMALAGGGAIRTVPPSLHTLTNIEVVSRFLPVEVQVEGDDRHALLRVAGPGLG
ncbi:RNA 3'-terminal phosphate cyclase [Haliangium sp.]|uniref:RNA 3'-terminal phosphate cyclase n=1 Tax=Haliangium sp. TaxID=2663208 RepID=UPI003D0E53B6